MKRVDYYPIYSQIAYDIASKIAAGTLIEGQRFTGRSLMGATYNVSPETIRRSLHLLSDMGIISIHQHLGSIVVSREKAVEYIERHQVDRDILNLKLRLQELVVKRNSLNAVSYTHLPTVV